MKPLVISLGGSMLSDAAYAGKFAAMLSPLLAERKFAVVVGGGQKAGKYADEARKARGSEFYADEAAIKATRENAETVRKAFAQEAWPKIITYPAQATEALKAKQLVVSGGFIEGITTDACSALVAEAIGAEKIINVSKVGGICDKNPSEFKDAKMFTEMTHEQLVEISVKSDQRKARTNFPFDLLAAKLAARSSLEIDFVGGLDLEEVKNALQGKKFEGTLVRG